MCLAALQAPFHVGIATPDPDAVQGALSALLGVSWVALERPPVRHYSPTGEVDPAPRVSYSAQGPLHLEVLQSAPGTIYDPQAGTHLHHLGYWTSRFDADLAALQAEGWLLEVSMRGADGQPATFAYLTTPGQTRVELVDDVGREALRDLLASGLVGPGPATP